MYTATKLGESINQQKQRLIITVRFDDGAGHVFDKDFEFGLTTPLETKKKAVKAYLDEINLVIVPVDDFVPTPDPTPTPPTQAELDRQTWEADFARLEKMQRLINCGALTGSEPFVTSLRTKVKNDLQQSYLG
jgi:hypothetical protein